mmetsp:Transcript_25102/g.53301  ORF Transcript_25102/g.53301 Transcript_25102/m.53301 type:complete len:460 (+) Transcript_25102:104-1483(+)
MRPVPDQDGDGVAPVEEDDAEDSSPREGRAFAPNISGGSRSTSSTSKLTKGNGTVDEEVAKRHWQAMVQQGLRNYACKNPEVFRRRARRGVPMEYRWQAWKAALGLEERMQPGLYQEYVQADNQWTRLIEIDMPRTFPDIEFFDKEQQYSLLRILKAFANFDPEVGYCQGMNFVTGLLLFVAQNGDFRQRPRFEKEEEVFWMLVCLMVDERLSGFYLRQFPLLRRYLWAFDHLLASYLPDLQAHFLEEGVQHGVYLHQWFLTLFINCLPLPMVLVFWDTMICGGRGLEAILPMTLSLLQALQNVLLSMSFEDIVRFFKTIKKGERHSDPAIIGKYVIAKCGAIRIPPDLEQHLREPFSLTEEDLFDEGAAATSSAASSDEDRCVDSGHRDLDSQEEGQTGSFGAAFTEWPPTSESLGSYFQSIRQIGRDFLGWQGNVPSAKAETMASAVNSQIGEGEGV